jgi:hypothetical protein
MNRLLGFLLALLTASTLSAQTTLRGDGRQATEKPGLALVKPQKWSKPNEALVVRFTAYTNRGGYFVLRSPSGQERQVWIEQMVGGAPILEPQIPAEILVPAHRNALQSEYDNIRLLAAKVPSAARDLAQLSQPLADAIQRFDAGEVRIDGHWETASSFRTREFSKVEARLRQSISEEPEKSKFDLPQNSLFKQLVELSKDNPGLQARVETIRANFQKQILAEHQARLLSRLSDPNTSSSDVLEILAQLRAVQNPSEQIVAILQQAEAASILEAEIAKFEAAMDSRFASLASTNEPPRLPADLAFQSEMLAKQVRKFRESAPPAAIRIPDAKADAIAAVCEGFPKISPLLEQRNYVEAAALLNQLAAQAAKFSPSTQTVLLTAKTAATQKVDLFAKLRAEGEVEEAAGNKPAAIAKYSAALEISPNAELSAKIEQLKDPAK